jgi:uncharacterized protein YbaR (Trm112 family)
MRETRANLYIEVLCNCPNCGYGLDVFDNDSIKESLDDDHRASGCDVEITCEDCNETFLVTDIDF